MSLQQQPLSFRPDPWWGHSKSNKTFNFQLVITCKISRSKAPSWWTPSLNLNLVRWASKGMKPPFSAMAKNHQDFCFNGPSDCTTQVFNAFNAFHASKKWKNSTISCGGPCSYVFFVLICWFCWWITCRVESVRPWEFEAFWRERVSSRDMIHHVRLAVLAHCRQVCFFIIQDHDTCEQTQPSI